MYSTGAQYANRLDDFRNTGQGVTSQLGAGGQPQTGNVDDFPPLTRNTHADLGQNSRSSLLQSGVGNYGLGQTFAGQAQARNALAASINGQEVNRIMSPGITTSAGMLYDGRCSVIKVLEAYTVPRNDIFKTIGQSRTKRDRYSRQRGTAYTLICEIYVY